VVEMAGMSSLKNKKGLKIMWFVKVSKASVVRSPHFLL
jgi:hypothetical protein